jgi:hypothetical protein
VADFNGDGIEELIVDSDWGGVGTVGSSVIIFDLSDGGFKEILDTTSRVSYEDQDWFTQTLDIDRTRQHRGAELCFTKTLLFDKGIAYHPARVTKPCYKRGDGVDLNAAQERNSTLERSR